MDLPKQFLSRMKNLLPDYDEFIDSYNNQPVKSFFINNNKITEKQFLDICEWDICKHAEGFKLLEDIKVGKTPEHHAGMIYMQELSAMMPVTFLPLKDDDWVIDLCASPGGKSIQVANKIPNGVLVSNEIVKSRANILKSNVERMGLTNVIVTNNEPKAFEEYFSGVFDAVVVDAPCSGEGMFRKDENAIVNWSDENVKACAVRQRAILETANKLLKADGYILYSTCTFSMEENEQVIADFCSNHQYEIVPICYTGATSGEKIEEFNTNNTLRFYPHRFDGEGQFVALLKKKEQSHFEISEKRYMKPLAKFPTEYKMFKNFCEDNLNNCDDILGNAIINNNVIYYLVNRRLAESGINLISCGVVLGEMVKGRFEPNHNLVTCFGDRFSKFINIDTDDVYKFLRGETLECDTQGYVAVKFKNVVIGFGKCVNGVLKNYYPKGLRNL